MSLIPEEFWCKIKEFLEANKTGNITLNCKEGQILQVKIEESIRLK